MLLHPHAAHAQAVPQGSSDPLACVTVGTTATCTGDLSGGVEVDGPAIETLNVNNLLPPGIAPAVGVDGIDFNDNGAATGITIDVDTTGTAGITTLSGTTAIGIDALEAGAGALTVTSTGDITSTSTGATINDDAYGISAMEGDADDLSVSSTGDIFSTAAGGDVWGIYAGEGDGGSVTVVSTGNITVNTSGDDAEGINVFELTDGSLTITSTGNITANATTTTAGLGDAYGIDAAEGGPGDLAVTSTGNITVTTSSDQEAYGIEAFEGDAGNASISSTGIISVTSAGGIAFGLDGSEVGVGDLTISSSGDIAVSSGGTGVPDNATGIDADEADAGSLSVTSTGDITATSSGGNAFGIVALERGDGDLTITSIGNITATSSSNSAFGISANENDDGSVVVTSTGNITAQGDNSAGIEASEYGAGTLSVTSTGNISTSGVSSEGIVADGETGGGSVTVTSTGNITTTGSAADGIRASSDEGGDVTVTSTGDITVSGNNASGVAANGTVGTSNTVNLLGGTIQGGVGNGAGVDFDGSDAGATNKLNIAAGVTVTALSGIAIAGANSDDSVHNSGTVIGNVDLDDGTNAFKNLAGGLFESGPTINLGAGNLLTNDGTLSPGGASVVATSNLTGDIVQNAPGTLLTTLDSAAQSADMLSGTDTAALAGNVQVNVINPAFGLQQQTIVTAAGGVTNNGLGLLASPALQAKLLFPNSNDVVLQTDIDFTAPGQGLNQNQTNIAANINDILDAGSGDVEPVVLALLNNVFSAADYTSALDQLSPQVYGDSEVSTLFAANEFIGNLFSCSVSGNGDAIIREGQCVWVKGDAYNLDRDATAVKIGSTDKVGSFSAGAQIALAQNWFAGLAVGYDNSSLETSTGADVDTDRFNIGGSLKYQAGPALLAGAISGGFASGDVDRIVTIGAFSDRAAGDADVDYFAAQLRAAWLFDQGAWYAKPFVDLTVTHVDRDGTTEASTNGAALSVGDNDETFFSIAPKIEFGTQVPVAAGTYLRPYVRGGITFFSDDDVTTTASFVGAPAGVGNFLVTSEFDDVFGTIDAGIEMINSENRTLNFEYQGKLASDTELHSFSAKATVPF